MKYSDIIRINEPCETERAKKYGLVVASANPHVQELITRFSAHQGLESGVLDRGDLALMGAVYMEVVDNRDWMPTSHIEYLLIDMNARLEHWEKNL